MAVAADRGDALDVGLSLDEVRALAREHTLVPLRHTFIADTETPVSAYLKLRGAGPSFLLESAEQGQRFGRWSFLGVQPRTVMRLDDGRFTVGGEERPFADPYVGVPDLALMVSDVLLAFDHFTHTVTVLANVYADGDIEARYAEAVQAIADVRERLATPVPRVPAERREPPEF